MIVLAADAMRRSFLGVDFVVLAVGAESMVTKMLYKAGDHVPLHHHPNEQSGYVVSGRFRLAYEGVDEVLTTGDSYSITRNTPHTLEIIEPGEVVDVFTPPREDYL